jgi:CheY-like chemotaxis protein
VLSHVLIIEDEPMIAMAIEAALEDAGVTSFEIVDTESDAVIAARNHRPDLITSDVALRLGTGPCAVRAIHCELGDIPVIFLTGTPDDCKPCQPPGSILSKPFDADTLISAYRRAIGDASLH